MVTKKLFRPLISMCFIGLAYIICFGINIFFPIQMEGGLSWVFGFNIAPVMVIIVSIFILEIAMNITSVIGRSSLLFFIALLLYMIVFRGIPTQVGLVYSACSLAIYLISILLDKQLIRKYGGSSIINFFLVFFFSLGACAVLGGRPIYESQLYFFSFIQDYKFILIILASTFLIFLRAHFFPQSFRAFFILLLAAALISVVFIHPIMKAVAFDFVIIAALFADYAFRARSQSVG